MKKINLFKAMGSLLLLGGVAAVTAPLVISCSNSSKPDIHHYEWTVNPSKGLRNLMKVDASDLFTNWFDKDNNVDTKVVDEFYETFKTNMIDTLKGIQGTIRPTIVYDNNNQEVPVGEQLVSGGITKDNTTITFQITGNTVKIGWSHTWTIENINNDEVYNPVTAMLSEINLETLKEVKYGALDAEDKYIHSTTQVVRYLSKSDKDSHAGEEFKDGTEMVSFVAQAIENVLAQSGN
ncbi:MAG: hypothetical protein ACRC42_00710 [Mycoplasma sp.]